MWIFSPENMGAISDECVLKGSIRIFPKLKRGTVKKEFKYVG
jgi:hypothetical protein